MTAQLGQMWPLAEEAAGCAWTEHPGRREEEEAWSRESFGTAIQLLQRTTEMAAAVVLGAF